MPVVNPTCGVALPAGEDLVCDFAGHLFEELVDAEPSDRARRLADRVIVAILENDAKKPLFSVEERIEMIQQIVGSDAGVSVRSFSGLLVDFAAREGATLLVRGLRAISDYEYELQMALMNRRLAPAILLWSTMLSVPIESGPRLVGVINVQHRSPHQHTGNEMEVLTTVGEQVGCLLVLARMEPTAVAAAMPGSPGSRAGK